MKSTDPASLQNLNDIVVPATTGWWPLASGWYVVLALLLMVLVWFSYQSIKGWINNRYRRAALRELESLSADIQNGRKRDFSLRQIPVLLKRTALSAYPRNQVASLSGESWHDFLNSKLTTRFFTEGTASTLDNVSYSTGDLSAINTNDVTDLINVSKHWIKKHKATTPIKAGKDT